MLFSFTWYMITWKTVELHGKLLFIKAESHLQSATSRKIHPDNRTARGTHYRLHYNRQSNITERWKKWRTFDWWRRRTRIDVDVGEYEGVARPHRPVSAAQYILISRPFAGVSGSTQIGKLGSMRLKRRNPKPWERDTGRVAPRWVVLPPPPFPPRQGRETTSRDRGPADNHCKLPRICSAFRSLTRTDCLLLSTSVLYDYIPFRFHGKLLCRSATPITRCVPDVIWSATNFPPVVTDDKFISHWQRVHLYWSWRLWKLHFHVVSLYKVSSRSCFLRVFLVVIKNHINLN